MSNSNLNGLRQLISLAMRESNKSVTISTEMASMIVVEYEKHRVAASDAIGEIDACREVMEKLKADKRRLVSVVDKIISMIDDSFDDLTEEEATTFINLIDAYRAARGSL